MDYDILYVGQAVCLINCFLDREKLTYGFGFFSSNTPPEIILRDGNGNYVAKVAVPDAIVVNPIMEVMGDAHETNVLMRIHS
jgi:hypothetical protein